MRTVGLAIVAALALLVFWISGAQVSLPNSTQGAPSIPTPAVLNGPAPLQTPVAILQQAAGTRKHLQHGRAASPHMPITMLPGVPARTVHRAHAPQHRKASHGQQVTGVTVVIERLGVRAPVRERGIDPTGHLPIAPGYALTHFTFSAGLGELGNYVLYGHDDILGNILRYLPTMRVGDHIDLYEGALHLEYTVTGSKVVPPSDVSVLNPTPDATLTLISCTPFDVDRARIVVTATLLRIDDHLPA
jgi:LPXTG-site transpeptidase (sortase) family protein